MNAEDKREFAAILNGMAVIYGKELTKELYQIYWAAMADWAMADFKKAASHLMRQCEFFPRPHDFEGLRKLGRMSSHEAWELALQHAGGAWRQHMSCGNEQADRATSAIGGYQALAFAEISKHQFLYKRFCDAYDELTDSIEVREALPEIVDDKLLEVHDKLMKRLVKK